MKEYGEIENDLKLVQSICKNKQAGEIFSKIDVLPL